MRRPDPWIPPDQPVLGRHLRALGMSDHKIRSEVARGTLLRLRHGVYVAVRHFPDDPRQQHLMRAAAEQAVMPDLVASHGTAAVHWDLPLLDERTIIESVPSFSLPRGGSHRSARTSSSRVHVVDLPNHHVTSRDGGFRVTSLARTAVDVASGALPEMLVSLDAALRRESQQLIGVARRRDLANPRVQQAARRSLVGAASHGNRPATLMVAIDAADARRETAIESLSAGHMHLAELPPPIPQAPIETPLGLVFPDFLWPDHRLVGEADGAVKYRTQDVMMREKQREQVLRDLGFTIVRWTGREILVTPALVMARIARALDAC